MNLIGWNSDEAGVVEPVVAGELGHPADVAGQHPGPLDRVERPVERLRDRRLDEALAEPDPELARQDLDDVLRGQRVGPGEELAQDPALRRRPGRLPRSRHRRRRPRAASGVAAGSGA